MPNYPFLPFFRGEEIEISEKKFHQLVALKKYYKTFQMNLALKSKPDFSEAIKGFLGGTLPTLGPQGAAPDTLPDIYFCVRTGIIVNTNYVKFHQNWPVCSREPGDPLIIPRRSDVSC